MVKRKSLVISKKETMDVYSFMSLCGLECNFKDNVRVSHNIMLSKLALRHNEFPDKVFMPIRIGVKDVKTEDVLSGYTIIVRDDYGRLMPYKNPRTHILDLLEQISTSMPETEFEKREEAQFKNGYINYMIKKAKRMEEEEKRLLEELKQQDEEEIETITENVNRCKRLYKGREVKGKIIC